MSWTLRTLLDAAGIEARTTGDAPVGGIAYDSRSVDPGDLFCCFGGASADGHDHAPVALEQGASSLLVERPLPLDVPQARVDRVRPVLGPLAHAFFDRPSEGMAVCGVTGTNGKTTTTYILEAIAEAAGRTPGVIGTVSVRAGAEDLPAARSTPEAPDLQRVLARMRDGGCDLVAMEVTSHGLDQGRVAGTRFAAAGFTNLSRDHLDYHRSFDGYFEAKMKLFAPSYTRRAVVNVADAYGRRIVERAPDLDTFTYGTADADLRCEDVATDTGGTRGTLVSPAGSRAFRMALAGGYNVENLLCATGLALHAGLTLDDAVEGAEALRVVPGRLEPVDAGQPFAVLVDYAHTPAALSHAIELAAEQGSGRLIVVFGCGGDRDREKRPLMGEAATRRADLTVLTSDNPRSEDPDAIIEEIRAGAERGGGDYTICADRREAIGIAIAEARPDDVVLIAGKGHEQGQTFADRTVPFDDREVARELLRSGSRL